MKFGKRWIRAELSSVLLKVKDALRLSIVFSVFGISVGKKEVMDFCCEQSFATRTASSATCKLMTFPYEGDLREKYFFIQMVVRNKVEDFLNVNESSCNL